MVAGLLDALLNSHFEFKQISAFALLGAVLLLLSATAVPALADRLAQVTITIPPPPGILLSKSLASPPVACVISDTLVYNIRLKNVGSSILTTVWAVDEYPAQCIEYTSAVPAPSSVNATDGKLIWNDLTTFFGDIVPGRTVTVTVEFHVHQCCKITLNKFLSTVIDNNGAARTATATHVVPCVNLCCADAFPDYAPNGMPDFDQKQDEWSLTTNDMASAAEGRWTHDGPVAAADALWWLDSRFETNTTPPPFISDTYPLVTAYDPEWDDHAPENVPPFVEELAHYVDTNGLRTAADGVEGTEVEMLYNGIVDYIVDKGLAPEYAVHLAKSPTYEWVRQQADCCIDPNCCSAVILLLGFWERQDTGWQRLGGHYVVVDCVGLDEPPLISFSDPFFDRAEHGWPGRVAPIPDHEHPPYVLHNDAAYLSHDRYAAVSVSAPFGVWAPQGYVTEYADISNFFGQNFGEELEPYRAAAYKGGAVLTSVEYAIAVQPAKECAVTPIPTDIPTATSTPTSTPTATEVVEETPTPTATEVLETPTPTATPTAGPGAYLKYLPLVIK